MPPNPLQIASSTGLGARVLKLAGEILQPRPVQLFLAALMTKGVGSVARILSDWRGDAPQKDLHSTVKRETLLTLMCAVATAVIGTIFDKKILPRIVMRAPNAGQYKKLFQGVVYATAFAGAELISRTFSPNKPYAEKIKEIRHQLMNEFLLERYVGSSKHEEAGHFRQPVSLNLLDLSLASTSFSGSRHSHGVPSRSGVFATTFQGGAPRTVVTHFGNISTPNRFTGSTKVNFTSAYHLNGRSNLSL